MTSEFSCPGCEKVLKTSDDKAGRRAKCPQCGEPITVPAAQEPDLFDDGFEQFDTDLPVPERESFLAGSNSPADIQCPMCGAANPRGTLTCDYCGEMMHHTVHQRWEPNQIKVGEVFSRSWQLYTEHLGLCVAVPFLASLLSMLLLMALFAVLILLFILINGALMINGAPAAFSMGLMILIFIIASTVVLNYFEAGTQVVLLKIALGEETGLNDLFSGGRFLLRMILCGIVFQLVVGFGNMIFFLIGFFLGLLFWPYPYLLIDRNLPGIEAFTGSIDLTKKNLLSMTLVFLAIIGIPLLLGAGLILGGMMLIEFLNVSPLPVILTGGVFAFVVFGFVYTFQMLVRAVAYRCMTRIN
ncbi:hypothetical protein [Gimesia algae]|uniref:Double zinc ribbon n=1 Tax=Gimesia algae TaxID=2527971 RepID=A0A517VC91_9PLAN|nr:hypothetical protein [Gimesia algae]QDT90615.1 hypothetical protein Pan161_22680 [Gimesia algae]